MDFNKVEDAQIEGEEADTRTQIAAFEKKGKSILSRHWGVADQSHSAPHGLWAFCR
jgi:hypothetical protein